MKLRNMEFDLLYLGLLTKEQVKPLSRWEGEFRRTEIKALKSLGLKTKTVERDLASGRISQELVFSEDAEMIRAYANAFAKKPIDHSRETALLEGRLFGYPECCVNSFVTHGYAPNGLSKEDQKILFHWACSDCKFTPGLLPRYRDIYEEARRLRSGYSVRSAGGRRVAALVSTLGLASCLLLAGCSHKSTSPTQETDVHWITLEKDADQDYLKDEWEVHLGLSPYLRDTDRNGVLDGPQLAKSMSSIIQNPPDWIDWLEFQANDMRGFYTCSKCGQGVNMGFVQITNTRKNESIQVGYLSLHFMQHGSFAYEGGGGVAGVVNPVQLDSVLSE
ncbi:MAG: hypothetical protein GTO24_22735 [candidate division Zixibacteria bacterium]|nr:hypothetical protein [candidate division Zixibacteria bacterium]